MSTPDRTPSQPTGASDADTRPEPTIEPLTLKGSFGTAMGAAMLGPEQALRDGPPPQIQAAEHVPDRRTVSGEGGLRIDFPDSPGATEDEAG